MAKVTYLSFSDVDSFPYLAPGNLRDTNVTSTSITIAFDAGADDITPTAELRYDREVNGTIISRSTAGDLAWTRNNLTPDTEYVYRFRTVDELDQVGDWSEERSITTTSATTSLAINPATETDTPISIIITGGESAISDYLILTSDALNPSIRPNQIVLSGEQGNYSISSTQNNRTFDARNATFTPNVSSEPDSYVVKINDSNTKGDHIAFIGGYIDTNLSLTLKWREVKSNYDGTGIRFYGDDWILVDGTRFYNVQDGWRPRGNLNKWCERNSWHYYIRDDFIENDGAGSPGGLIHDSLWEGGYMGLSCGQNQTWNGVEDMTIKRLLMHIMPMPYDTDIGGSSPYLESEYGVNQPRHGHPFKQHNSNSSDYPIHLIDSIIFVEQHSAGGNNQDNEDLLVKVAGSDAENTLLIWLEDVHDPGDPNYTLTYPGNYPSGITEINRQTINPDTGNNYTEAELRGVFTTQANIFKTRHGYKSGATLLSTFTDPATNILDASKIIAPDDFQPFNAASYKG